MKEFLERLETEFVVGDGGTGSLLFQAYPDLRCVELANTAYQEAVMDIHLRFIAAGAQIIEMNTCGANQYKLEAHGVSPGDVPTLNSAAINLAQEAREVSGK